MRLALALISLLLALAMIALWWIQPAGGWFPPLISDYGAVDAQFRFTFIITIIPFILLHLALGYLIWRYGNEKLKARYSLGNTSAELIFTALIAVIFLVTAYLGNRVWQQIHPLKPPADPLTIEVTGQQFAWNFRYPGADNRFGRTDAKLIKDEGNRLGIDPSDLVGQDDLVRRELMVIPAGRPIQLIMRSRDVTHSFFVPQLRVKQDAVPGLSISVYFTALKTGKFEIACAELCGAGHHRMRAILEVRDQNGYQQWLETGK